MSGGRVLVATQQDSAGSIAVHETSRTMAPAARELGVVVDLSKRQLDIRVNGELAGTYEVAVGQPGHRTPRGTYPLSRVIWNPAWVPPDRAWARDEEHTPPGDPDNPMGRVKIYFDDLYYIHGTYATETLGEPVSHGCIRMRNEDAMRLARLVMEHGGAGRSESWYAETRKNRTETREVAVPDPPLLRITR
jgi:lipoprotein-anchoring transpeptidase ErfK/SrfK